MTDSRTAVRTEIAAAAVLAAAAAFAMIWLIPAHTQPASSDLDIAPAFFPMLAASIVLVLSLAMIVVRLTRDVASLVTFSARRVLVELVIWAGVALAIRLALTSLGFLPTAILVVALGGIAVGFRRWWVLGLLAVVFSAVVDVGAWQIFTVDMP